MDEYETLIHDFRLLLSLKLEKSMHMRIFLLILNQFNKERKVNDPKLMYQEVILAHSRNQLFHVKSEFNKFTNVLASLEHSRRMGNT